MPTPAAPYTGPAPQITQPPVQQPAQPPAPQAAQPPAPQSTQPPAAQPDPAAPPSPQWASIDTVNQLQTTIAELKEELEYRGTRQGTAHQAQPSAPEPIPEPNYDGIDQAIADGKPAAQIIKSAVGAEVARIKHEFDNQLNQIQQMGLSTLNEQSEQLTSNFAYLDNPKIAREYGRKLNELDPALRASPRARKQVHEMVLGANFKDLVQIEVERALHESQNPPEGTIPAGANGRTTGTSTEDDHVPTVEEFYGPEQAQALRAKGQTPDQFARSIPGRGFNNWADYVKFVKNQQSRLLEASQGGTA